MIPYGRHSIGEDEIRAVVDVLKSDYLTTGPIVEKFENKVARYCNARHAIAVSNGTAALHVAVMALELEKGVEGITSPNTFLASANCMAYCGITPRFADIEMNTYCIDPDEIRKKITPATRLLIPVHFAGHPCDMESIWDLAGQKNLYVIEDAAHAIGSEWKDGKGTVHKIGTCSHSHMTIFSFHPVKTITTGEGGMILTNDKSIAEKCRLFRNHGMEKNPHKWTGFDENSIDTSVIRDVSCYYEMQVLGHNFRLSDIHGALGLIQMDRLTGFIRKRRDLWKVYNDAFRQIEEMRIPIEKEGVKSGWHLYVLQTMRRDELLLYLHKNGIHAHAMYFPVHLQPWYRKKFGYQKGDFKKSEEYFKNALILPLYQTLKASDQKFIIKTIQKFFKPKKNDG